MKSFRNAFLVTALASATLLGWGCREGGQVESPPQEPAGQQEGMGGAGTPGEDVGGTGSGVDGTGGAGTGDVPESGDMGPGTQDDQIRGGMQDDTGNQTGTQPDTGR
jgi:hypothetical protein